MTSVKRFLPIQGPGAAASALAVLGIAMPVLGPNPVLGWVTAQVLPGLGAALLLPPAATPVLLARAFLLGPLVTGLLGVGLRFAGAPALLPWASWGFGVLALLAAWALRRRGGPRGGPAAAVGAETAGPADQAAATWLPGAADPGVRMAIWIGLALAVAVLAPGLAHPWVRERADSWFHAAIVAEIEQRGIPPQDPFFAGISLKYMWLFHVILAGFRQMTGLSAFLVMTFLNATALWALCVAAADLSAALGRGGRAAAFSALVVPLGLSVLFWLFLPIRALFILLGPGGAAGVPGALGGGQIDITHTRMLLTEFGSFPFFLNKFLVGTAYGPALAFLLLYLAGLARYASTRRGVHLATIGVSMAAMLLLHPVVGFSAIGISGLTGVALVLLRPDRGGLRLAEAVKWGGVVAVAAAFVAPYLWAVTSHGPGQRLKLLHVDPLVLAGIFSGCLFVILAAARPIRDLWRAGRGGGGSAPSDARPAGRLMVAWTAMTVLFIAFIKLPGPSAVDKFTYLLHLPLAVLAGSWAADAWRGRRGALLALLLLGPANLIGYAGYWGEPEWRERSPEVIAAWQWLADNTPANAVALENKERVDVVVTVPRRLYWGRQAYTELWGYDPSWVGERRGACEAVYAPGSALEPATLTALRRIHEPLYVIFRGEDFTSPDDFHKLDRFPDAFDLVFSRPGVRIYRLKS